MEDAGIRNIYNFDCPIEEAMRTLVKEQYGRVTRALPVKLAAAGGFTPMRWRWPADWRRRRGRQPAGSDAMRCVS